MKIGNMLKFCSGRGEKLERKGTDCGNEIKSSAKFCDECGTKLGASGPDLSTLEKKIDKIQKYLPEGLTQKILSQKDRIEGETRLMLVLAKICLKTPHRFLAEPVGR